MLMFFLCLILRTDKPIDLLEHSLEVWDGHQFKHLCFCHVTHFIGYFHPQIFAYIIIKHNFLNNLIGTSTNMYLLLHIIPLFQRKAIVSIFHNDIYIFWIF